MARYSSKASVERMLKSYQKSIKILKSDNSGKKKKHLTFKSITSAP